MPLAVADPQDGRCCHGGASLAKAADQGEYPWRNWHVDRSLWSTS